MADKQLFAARKEFVKRVKKDLIVQLLDDLLEDEVVNDGEKDAVIEENSSTADKARCLIDKVRSKGPKASEKLISRLQERDRALCMQLNLGAVSAFEPKAPKDKLPQQEANAVSPVLLSCTKEFKRKVLAKEAGSIYLPKEKGQRKRLALLINNRKFDQESMLRSGSEKDVESMEKLLKALDYTVEKHPDLSSQEIDETLKAFSEREEHAESDSTFVVIMSHGKRDAICGVHFDPDHPEGKKDLFPIDNIFNHLNNKNCAGLRGKPKVIVVQACRGDESGTVWVCDSVPEPRCLEDDSIRKELKEKDFICLMSCTPDAKAYRDSKDGAIFIQKLVEAINTHAHKDDVMELFRKVMKKFENSKYQMPALDRTTAVNKFYLFPGL